jgi:hypothetical protein
MSLDGKIVSELPLPPQDPQFPEGPMGPYCPCGCAVDEERFGGTGDIWVADGYGSGLVHRFDKDGNHLSTLTGEEGSGRLLCPHAIFIDRRNDKVPELYIADRINVRVLVYDLDGQYLRTFGETSLNSPSDFAQWGDLLVVAEIYQRLAFWIPTTTSSDIGAIRSRSGARVADPAGWATICPKTVVRRYRFSPNTIVQFTACGRGGRRRQPLRSNGCSAADIPSSPRDADRSRPRLIPLPLTFTVARSVTDHLRDSKGPRGSGF